MSLLDDLEGCFVFHGDLLRHDLIDSRVPITGTNGFEKFVHGAFRALNLRLNGTVGQIADPTR